MNVRLRRHAQDIGHGHPFPGLESTENGGFGCGENEKWRSYQETPRYRAPFYVRAMRRKMKIRGRERNKFTLEAGQRQLLRTPSGHGAVRTEAPRIPRIEERIPFGKVLSTV